MPATESLEQLRDRLFHEAKLRKAPAPAAQSLEKLRDRLFREAKARKTPALDDPEDGRATIPRIPVDKVIRTAQPAPARVIATAPQPEERVIVGGSVETVVVDRPRMPWTIVIVALSVIAVSLGLMLLLSN